MTSTPATDAASRTISDLSARFPSRVQIHLHPSTSVPAGLVATTSSGSWRPDLAVALVWTVDSLRLLRQYGVTGSFTGTLAQFPQQNVFLGLPVQLLPEEVVYLVRRGCAVVVDEGGSYRASEVGERVEVRERVEAERKGQQLEAWTERQALRARHASSHTEQTPTPQELDALPWHYTIPTTSSHLPWYTPTTYTTLSSLQPIYAFPTTADECGRVALFEHFLDQGMWCMNGLRFGGTFAVYPGDPLRYHSHYTAELIAQTQDIAMTRLVANGRLGTAVKKTHLLCCVERFEERLQSELREQEQEQGKGRSGLEVVRNGWFDVAVSGAGDTRKEDREKGEKRTKFAEFRIFSLAWSGFGT